MPVAFAAEADLCVITLSGVIKKDEADELVQGVDAWMDAHPGKGARFLCDLLAFKVYAPEAADTLVALMKRVAPRLEKAAFVAAEGTAHLQLARMIRDAGSDKRRLFTEMADARAWLLEP